MAATDHTATSRSTAERPMRRPRECLSPAGLAERLDEEVGRAERQRGALSCLLVSVEGIDRLAPAPGADLSGQAIAYLGQALERQLRRYDRVGRPREHELAVVLPGADQRRGEIVARRALGRMHAIKVEYDGVRHPLRVSVGIAAWRNGLSGEQLLDEARLAAQAGSAEDARAGGPEDALPPSSPPAGS
jgi:diguanylate cyclase (GGDEF)-like protein